VNTPAWDRTMVFHYTLVKPRYTRPDQTATRQTAQPEISKKILSARALPLSCSTDDAWDPADPTSWPPGTAPNGSLGSKCAGLYACVP
jgi:hypothetical protein